MVSYNPFKQILFSLPLLFYANVVMATNYECNTEQELQWVKGKFSPDKNKVSWAYAIIQFNDTTGDFWIKMNEESSPNSLSFKVVKNGLPDGQLLAIADNNEKFYMGSSFRIISNAKEKSTNFLFYSTSVNSISTGKCHIYDKEIPSVLSH